jgi:hypothetical protein
MDYKTFAALVDARLAAARKSQTNEQQLDDAAINELLDFVNGVDGGAALVCAAARDALADAVATAEAAAAVPDEDAEEAVKALRLLSQKKAVVAAEQLHLPHEKRGRTRVDASQVEDLFKPAPASTMLLSLLSSLLLPVIIFLLLMLLLHSCSSSQAGRIH